MNRDFSVPFLSLNMSAQPRKYGSPPKNVVPETIKGVLQLVYFLELKSFLKLNSRLDFSSRKYCVFIFKWRGEISQIKMFNPTYIK